MGQRKHKQENKMDEVYYIREHDERCSSQSDVDVLISSSETSGIFDSCVF